MKIDIHTGVITFVALLSILAAYGIWAGIRSIRKARSLKFFRMRRDRMLTGWRMLFLSVGFILVAILTRRFAEPIAYPYFPPLPTPAAVFSPLQFAQALDKDFVPIDPATVFQNPVGHLYAQFTYDKMTPGAQWSALWYFGNELVYYETDPWDGGPGGVGYSDWNPEPSMWRVGEYEVQI